MNDVPVVIKVENVGKKYVIKHKKETVHEENYKFGFKRLKNSLSTHDKEDFWALKDVNFEIRKGERVGIIGKNGAGKSTLLKLLSRITEPATGRIELLGSVSAMLEVGTGFNMELTGRENVYLNGAILGMPKSVIDEKFDEIVEFAEIGEFIDTPVKRYSSGMYVRLAFSVASTLRPDILIVDEVLSVGDTKFRMKCLERMASIGKEGRTILCVSHIMTIVRSLCNRVIVLDHGKIIYDGDVEGGIKIYNGISATDRQGHHELADKVRSSRSDSTKCRMTSLDMLDTQDSIYGWDDTIKFRLNLDAFEDVDDVGIRVTFRKLDGVSVSTAFIDSKLSFKKGKKYSVDIAIPHHNLSPDDYQGGITLTTGNVNDFFNDLDDVNPDAFSLTVLNTGDTGANDAKRLWYTQWGLSRISGGQATLNETE